MEKPVRLKLKVITNKRITYWFCNPFSNYSYYVLIPVGEKGMVVGWGGGGGAEGTQKQEYNCLSLMVSS